MRCVGVRDPSIEPGNVQTSYHDEEYQIPPGQDLELIAPSEIIDQDWKEGEKRYADDREGKNVKFMYPPY